MKVTIVPTSLQSESKVIPIASRTAGAASSPGTFKTRHCGQSLRFALKGVLNVFQQERNFRRHVLIAGLVIVAGLLYHITVFEWAIVSVCIGLMLAVEALNSAIEYTVDLITGGIYHEKAKLAKDAAAGACLLTAIMSVMTGLCIFIPYIGAQLHR